MEMVVHVVVVRAIFVVNDVAWVVSAVQLMSPASGFTSRLVAFKLFC